MFQPIRHPRGPIAFLSHLPGWAWCLMVWAVLALKAGQVPVFAAGAVLATGIWGLPRVTGWAMRLAGRDFDRREARLAVRVEGGLELGAAAALPLALAVVPAADWEAAVLVLRTAAFLTVVAAGVLFTIAARPAAFVLGAAGFVLLAAAALLDITALPGR